MPKAHLAALCALAELEACGGAARFVRCGELDVAAPLSRPDLLEAVLKHGQQLHSLAGWCLPHKPRGVIRWAP